MCNFKHVKLATCTICNTCNLQACNLHHVQFATCVICNTCNLHYVKFAECAIGNTCNLQHIQLLTCVISNTCKANQLDGSAIWISWTDKLDRPAGQTSWTDQLDGPAGRTSSLYLKSWPVRIFEDWPFSLYIVAASKSNEGLVFTPMGELGGSRGQPRGI